MSKNFYQKKAHLMSISGPVSFTAEQRSLSEVGLSTANVAHQSKIALPNP